MDLSFAVQFLSVLRIANEGEEFKKRYEGRLVNVEEDMDTQIANLKLEAMKISIDTQRPDQLKYLNSWKL